MTKLLIISKNTFKELLRNRVLYAFLVFAVFLVFLMVAIGQLSYTEQLRLTLSLGLSAIHLCIMGLTVFLGGSMIYKEIERLTILTILSRPISRTQFLLGKYFGFCALIAAFTFGFFAVFSVNLMLMGFQFDVGHLFVSFLGILVEAVTLLAVTTFFSTFCASFLSILFSIGVFILAHWTLSSREVGPKDGLFYYTVTSAKKFLPNFEYFNWRLHALEPFVTVEVLFYGLAIAALWIILFLASASLIFRGKDFA